MAINFSGTSEYYEITAAGTTNIGSSGSCSVLAWVKTSDWDHDGGHGTVGGLWTPIGDWGNDVDGDFSLHRNVSANTVGITVRTSGGTFSANTSYPSTGVWHRLAAIYDESVPEVRIYVDSATAADTTATSGTRATRTAGIGIAGYPAGNMGNTEFLGDLAEIVFWNRVLTGTELTDLVATGEDPAAAAADAFLYYPMDTIADPLVDTGSVGQNLAETGTPTTSTHPTFSTSGALNFEIDSVLLTTQPTRIEVTEPSARTHQVGTGGWVSAARDSGTKVRAIWGVDVSKTAVMSELRSARNSLIAHQLEWDDVTGTHHTIQAAWLRDPSYDIGPEFLYRPITVDFEETA